MAKRKLLSEYQAAAMIGLSPRLLRWLAKYSAKQGVARKLQIAKEDRGVVFFNERELLSFNEWLKLPWPHAFGRRPPIPEGIRAEVRTEANGECAICQSHKDTCEAAHLDPVAKSKNNHPENLLWLCSNHHIAYDDGLFGPDEENAEFVVGFKISLHRHKKMLWRMQHEASRKLLLCLDDCDRLADQLKAAKTTTQVTAVEKIAATSLDMLPSLSSVPRTDPNYTAYAAITPSLSSFTASKKNVPTISARLREAQSIRKEYVAALGFVPCPLCKASGLYDGSDCPVCSGDGEIDETFAERVDLGEYEKVKCPLCKGKGSIEGDDCPECGGDQELQRGQAERVDLSQYEKVKCPLCKGQGSFQGDDCPECGGNRKLQRGQAERVDLNQYVKVKCPLCKGKGSIEGDDCPECGGDRELQRGQAERVDLSQYEKVKCPLCKGKGSIEGDDCPECGGDRELQRGQAERVDLSQYEKVECPLCNGSGYKEGDDCPFCGGDKKVPRHIAETFADS